MVPATRVERVCFELQSNAMTASAKQAKLGANGGTRTHGLNLGKVAR